MTLYLKKVERSFESKTGRFSRLGGSFAATKF